MVRIEMIEVEYHPDISFEFITLAEAKRRYVVESREINTFKNGKFLGKMKLRRLKDGLHFGAGLSCCFEKATIHLKPNLIDEEYGYPPGIIAHDILHILLCRLLKSPEIAEMVDSPLLRRGILKGYLSPVSGHNYNWGNDITNCIDVEYEEGEF